MAVNARLTSLAGRCIDAIFGRPDVVDITNTIGGDRRVGTVKAWGCAGKWYVAGDAVPHLSNRSTYSLATVEGWYVHVSQGRITSWSRKAIHGSVADVYGRLSGPKRRRGLLG